MNIYVKDEEIATKNIVPQKRVYGEQLFEENGEEFRFWNPNRSKLAAAFLNGLEKLEISQDWKVLYLGASTGTTVSHISDIAKDGLIYAVEFSPVSMRKLVRLCEIRPNIAPILADATKPKKYMDLLEKVDFVYCDVAQPNQTNAFIDNINLFLKDVGLAMIMIKSRSIDVNQKPQKIFKQEEKKLKEKGFSIVEKVKLEPYEKDHICFLVKKNF
ncbi:fibrillarin-like rRNA/tRNA 2'-O-methyltransferase [Methanobrevibacter sp. TMH8]|uniref:fibrillarin-like rRNA/tRNA 2'-O-methyltransferase n=1 Tax=Methanobrevibacter sp. TMH8 TaxID=2848611 RepID=UPI001CCC431C|nr:fibrillarin-like rRNA/tRNA 2'-O-methyltransferase [Methanobrevibacter sp. TMH8]MBZ9571437.1 fibrillarin-like rRNA/tRNA 2'-O-methyltransferase [Methanobrevibacter sp. TMH8]